MGAFTAKAAVKPRKIQTLWWPPTSAKSKLPAESPAAMIATSMRSDPAIV
jgi:hypothetical protein